MQQRNQWASKLGFLLATAGAAIGLGNLWKFPYLMGRNGGFAFLVAYLIFVVILGIPVMMVETSLGRHTGKDPVHSYKMVHPKAGVVGVLGVLAAFMILSYYSVIGGWILKYIASYATAFTAPADFNTFIADGPQAVIWHLVFMTITVLICLKGVKGIEKANKFMMPALFVLLIITIVRSVTLPGASEGFKFIFTPTEGSFSLSSISAALGQVFYSLSLCMGITITYGSYLKKGENIPKACATVAGLDTLVALLAGIAIFPAVFALGQQPDSGPSLIFVTLPKVFEAMLGGPVFALAFFFLILFAAITSAIALLEVPASYAIDSWGWSRKKAVLVMGLAVFAVGVPSALAFGPLSNIQLGGYSLFDLAGILTDNILLPIGGILMCWFIGWKWNPEKLANEVEDGCPGSKFHKLWRICIRYITPVLVLIVTISGFVSIYQQVTGR